MMKKSVHTHFEKKDIPVRWFKTDALSEEEAKGVLKDVAWVAQKCTGRAKKPVFLFPTKVVKGPWDLEKDAHRLRREFACVEWMNAWTLSKESIPVLTPSLYIHPKNQKGYVVYPALYAGQAHPEEWVLQSESRSVSNVGPRILKVATRESLKVVRVRDRVQKMPEYLLNHPEIWEHLIHRYVLECGDSGLHNMMIDPNTDCAIGVDLDERRNVENEDSKHWMSLLFKAAPAKKIQPYLIESLALHQAFILDVIEHILRCFQTSETQSLAEEYMWKTEHWEERVHQLCVSLYGKSF